MIRLAMIAFLLATPAFSAEDVETKEVSCGYQADVVAAIQKARLDRVRESKVGEKIAASDPQWPEKYNAAIPQLTAWIYEQKRRDLRKVDLAEQLREQCIENWDAIQEATRDLNN